jgi:hypothetical protein
MNKVQEIISSYMTKYTATDEQKKLASKRLEVCIGCEFWKQSAIRDFCSKCGCTTSAKVFSPRGAEACPEKRWIE